MGRVNSTLRFRDWFGPGPSVKTQPPNDVTFFDVVHVFKIYFKMIGVRCTKANGIIVGSFSASVISTTPSVQQWKIKVVIRLS